jgi:hypothetical protein
MVARCACLILLLTTPVLADPGGEGSDEKWRRELAGHVFVPSLTVADPFLSTDFTVDTGLGYSWINGPGFDVRGDVIGSGSYTAEAMALALAFQASVTRWLALRVGAGGGLNGGNDARSALVVGMLQPIVANVGATVSWKLARIVRLGGTLDFAYSYSKLIQPLNLVRDSLVANMVDASHVSQQFNGYSVLPGAVVAIAPHRAIGLLASAQYMWSGFYGDVTSVSLSYFNLGVSAQIDLRSIWERAKVGFLLSYSTHIPFQSSSRFTHILEGGFFYTGRRDVDLGLDVQLKWFDLRPDSALPLDTLQLVAIFLLRYHWN